jgi:hypothetical protein
MGFLETIMGGQTDPTGAIMGIGDGAPTGGFLNQHLSGGNTPQQHGYGISSPMQFVGYDSGPGLGQPNTQGLGSLDMTGPGAAENMFSQLQGRMTAPNQAGQFWGQNQGQMQQPGMGEGYASGVMGRYQDGTPGVTQNAGDAWSAFQGAKPDLMADPGLGAYYERAKERTLADLGKQQSARGVYGSSTGMDHAGQAITDLEADRAKNEAQYQLQRAGEQRGWESLGGQLASSADAASRAASQNELDWTSGLGSLAFGGQNAMQGRLGQGFDMARGVDQNNMNQWLGTMGAANMAQNAQQGRGQQLFNNQMMMGDRMAGMAMDAYGNMIQDDWDLMNSAMGMELGLGAEALGQDYRQQERIKNDGSWAADMFGSFMGGLF